MWILKSREVSIASYGVAAMSAFTTHSSGHVSAVARSNPLPLPLLLHRAKRKQP